MAMITKVDDNHDDGNGDNHDGVVQKGKIEKG